MPTYIRFLLLISFLIYSEILFGFQKKLVFSDSLEIEMATELSLRAYNLSLDNHILHDSTFYYFEKVKKTFKKYQQWSQLIETDYRKGYLTRKFIDHDSSLILFENNLQLAKQKLNNSDTLILRILNQIGLVYYELGYLDKAIQYCQQALSSQKYMSENKYLSYTYFLLASIYLAKRDSDKAMTYLEKRFVMKQKLGLNEYALGSYYETKAGILYLKGDLNEAKKLQQKTFEIFKRINVPVKICRSYFILGQIALEENKFDEALELFKEGLDFAKKNKPRKATLSNQYLSKLYLSIGGVYSKQKLYSKAHPFFLKSLEVDTYSKGAILNSWVGHSYLWINKYDSALCHFQQAIINTQDNFDNKDVYVNPNPANSIKNYNLFMLLSSKTIAFYHKFKSGDNPVKNLNEAYLTNKLALESIDITLTEFGTSGSKLSWSQEMHSVYEQGIKISLVKSQIEEDKKLKHKAFEIAEKSKSGVLLSGITSSKARHFGGIPDSLLNREKEQKIDLSFYQSQLQKQLAKKDNDSAKVIRMKEKILTLNDDIKELEKFFEQHYPKYYQLKYDSSQLTVSDIQKTLDEKTTFIEYFVGDSAMYAFTISKNEYSIKELPVIDSLEQKVKSLANFLKEKNKAGFSNTSYQLYQQLFEPLHIQTSNLIIIPDGVLWQLNFDLLISQKPKKLDYRDFQYLIKDFTISYGYSARLLDQDVKQRIQPSKNECLAFSYNNPDDISVGNYIAMRGFRNANLGDLPGTRNEIKAVSSVVDGAYYYGSYANEKNFKENAKDYNILHLALHGVIDDENPMNSKLYFTQSKDSLEDNYLHVYELYNMELNSEIAVLSACKTGSGKLIRGEGVMSLGRAFTYAGCKSLLLSQWDVSDAFTPGLMKDFYQNLMDGKTKAAALREAKLAYLAKADNLTSNPYFWAPMVQLGDNRPLKQNNYWIWITAVSSVFLLIGLGIYLGRKKAI